MHDIFTDIIRIYFEAFSDSLITLRFIRAITWVISLEKKKFCYLIVTDYQKSSRLTGINRKF